MQPGLAAGSGLLGHIGKGAISGSTSRPSQAGAANLASLPDLTVVRRAVCHLLRDRHEPSGKWKLGKTITMEQKATI